MKQLCPNWFSVNFCLKLRCAHEQNLSLHGDPIGLGGHSHRLLLVLASTRARCKQLFKPPPSISTLSSLLDRVLVSNVSRVNFGLSSPSSPITSTPSFSLLPSALCLPVGHCGPVDFPTTIFHAALFHCTSHFCSCPKRPPPIELLILFCPTTPISRGHEGTTFS